jgi:acetoin utilization deacetylase AcuC-like enzyme
MEIIYNKESLLYRLQGIERIGKLVKPDFEEDKLLELIHSPKYIRKVEQTCKYKQNLAEVNTNEFTFEAARKAVSTAVLAAQSGNFAAIRPPGHHSSKETAGGFCFFNNIAIATQNLLNEGKKVCLLDIDGHYGNGTERIFYKDGRVLFWSIYQTPTNYPVPIDNLLMCDTIHLRKGEHNAKGLIYNVPLRVGSTDKEFIDEIKKFVPKIKEFNPDYLGISAGFDGYYKDNLLNLKFTEKGYEEFGKIVGSLDTKTFGVLEGGYHPNVVSCIEHLVRGINSGKEVLTHGRNTIF